MIAETPRLPLLSASLLGAVAIGALLVAHAALSGDGAVRDLPGAGDVAVAVVFLLGTVWAVALGWGLLAGVVLGAADRTFGLAGALRRLRARFDEAGRDASAAAGILAALVCVGLWALVFVRLYESRDEEFLIKVRVASRFLAVAALGLAGACAAAWLPVHRAVLRGLELARLARWRSATWPLTFRVLAALAAGGALALAGAVWLMVSNEEMANVRRLPLFLLTLVLGHTVCTAALAWALRRRRLPRAAVAALVGAPAMVVALTAVALDRAPAVHEAAETRSEVQGLLLGTLRGLLDLDGDGYASLLAGGDCDDGDAAIGPHAEEVPGNGIDDDCQGGDADPNAVAAWVADPSLLAEEDEATGPSAGGATPAGAAPGAGADGSAGTSSGEGGTAPAPPGGAGTSAEAPAPAAPPPVPRKGLNVLLILVDTVRADHVGFYGYERDTTPAMDAFAAESVVFRHAYAQANNTPRSIPSLLTSRFPSAINWVRIDRNYPNLRDEEHTLAESLTEAGYRTEAETSHYYFVPKRNLDQGFAEWSNPGAGTIKESNNAVTAPKILPRAIGRLEKLAKRAEPWFLLVHFFEPHGSYMPHKPPADFGRALVDRYDGELRFADDHVGLLLRKVEELGLSDDTIVVITSDHGEAFREHRYYFHGHTVYNEELHVPLIMRIPGVSPRWVEERVALLDVAPTLLSAIGVPIAPSMQGVDLVPTILERKKRGLPIYAELLPYPNWPEDQRALILGHHKVLYTKKGNVWELYDLQKDPTEQENLFRTHPKASVYKQALLDWMARHANKKANR